MIKAEIKKLIKSGIIIIILVLAAAVCAYAVVDFDNNFGYGSGGTEYGISRYENMDEAQELLVETEENIAEVEELLSQSFVENRDYKEELLSELKTERNIYLYILENEIAYSDYNDYAYICAYKYDSAYSAAAYIYSRVNYFLPFVLALLAAAIMPLDFHTGTYRIIYSTSVPRKKVVLSRYFTWLIIAAALTLITCGAASALSFMFGGAEGTVIFANLSTVFEMNYFGFCAFETAGILFRTAVIGSVIFALGLFFKNAIVPAAVDIALCIGAYVAHFSEHAFLKVLVNGFNYAFLGFGANTFYILYSALILLAACAVLLVTSAIFFNERDFK